MAVLLREIVAAFARQNVQIVNRLPAVAVSPHQPVSLAGAAWKRWLSNNVPKVQNVSY